MTLAAVEHALVIGLADGTTAQCRLLTDVFPDHKLLIALLAAVTHRVTIRAEEFLRALAVHGRQVGSS